MAVPGARAYRPRFHYTPEKGWINDPNGLIYVDGQYHLFAQYYPHDTKWGPMHWSHAVSDDLLHWQHLPIALYPDALGMCFSGSAALVDGRICLMYTSHGAHEQQSVAFSEDGVRFTPYAGNPVIPNTALRDYRDPKVFFDAARGHYVVAIAAGNHVEFFAGTDMIHWEKVGEFSDQTRIAGIHECPDVFPLTAPDGSTVWVMIASMILLDKSGSRTQYALGEFDGETFRITRPFAAPEWVDAGWNNYAPVTYYGAPEPTAIGWANCWKYADRLPTTDYAGMMTLPRRLSLVETREGLRLSQLPVPSLDTATDDYAPIADGGALPGECFRLRVSGAAPYALALTNGQETLRVEMTAEALTVDLRAAGEVGAAEELRGEAFGLLRAKRCTDDDSLELVFDTCIAEIFADRGVRSATAPVFPVKPYTALRLEGAVREEIAEIRV